MTRVLVTVFALAAAVPAAAQQPPAATPPRLAPVVAEGVRVPDERIDALSKIFAPKKTTYAEMSFCDIPGEHGAEKKGLSAKALQPVREQDALCLVLRDFENPAIEGDPDPLRDLEAFHLECVFADLELVERRLPRAQKEHAPPREIAALELMKRVLDDGRPLRGVPAAELDRAFASRSARPREIEALVAAIGERQGALRYTHLKYHLIMLDVLDAGQAALYGRLRGYDKHP